MYVYTILHDSMLITSGDIPHGRQPTCTTLGVSDWDQNGIVMCVSRLWRIAEFTHLWHLLSSKCFYYIIFSLFNLLYIVWTLYCQNVFSARVIKLLDGNWSMCMIRLDVWLNSHFVAYVFHAGCKNYVLFILCTWSCKMLQSARHINVLDHVQSLCVCCLGERLRPHVFGICFAWNVLFIFFNTV